MDRPPLDVDFVAVCDAVLPVLKGNNGTITRVAKGLGVHIYVQAVPGNITLLQRSEVRVVP